MHEGWSVRWRGNVEHSGECGSSPARHPWWPLPSWSKAGRPPPQRHVGLRMPVSPSAKQHLQSSAGKGASWGNTWRERFCLGRETGMMRSPFCRKRAVFSRYNFTVCFEAEIQCGYLCLHVTAGLALFYMYFYFLFSFIHPQPVNAQLIHRAVILVQQSHINI